LSRESSEKSLVLTSMPGIWTTALYVVQLKTFALPWLLWRKIGQLEGSTSIEESLSSTYLKMHPSATTLSLPTSPSTELVSIS
jgi:hypothetical protein